MIIKVDFSTGQVINKMPAKFPVKKVTIHWAEGAIAYGDQYPMDFPSIKAASDHIKAAAHNFPKDGGYDKHKFTVEWDHMDEDGTPSTYTGRLDCKHYSCPDSDLDIAAHIKELQEWYLDQENREAMGGDANLSPVEEIEDFLNNYSFD